ncbi:phytosulfokines 3-like [Vicia villosa]|uniref:phytosulfokines 3-like n=1 Tax=Vicia villosa TaxID=3911 RepID=UPI00273CD4EA|nr:phytosulfokines 3-like [Vicia villosa]XP_058739186.1 phytosulfokines 3-like [Vicia villosa]
MSSKVSSPFCLIVFFFLFLTFTYATRLGPVSSPIISTNTQYKVLEDEKVDIQENCEGINEDDCLMRRTLVAHTDYIYTQKQNP